MSDFTNTTSPGFRESSNKPGVILALIIPLVVTLFLIIGLGVTFFTLSRRTKRLRAAQAQEIATTASNSGADSNSGTGNRANTNDDDSHNRANDNTARDSISRNGRNNGNENENAALSPLAAPNIRIPSLEIDIENQNESQSSGSSIQAWISRTYPGGVLRADPNADADADSGFGGDEESGTEESGSIADPEAGERNPPPAYVERWVDLEMGVVEGVGEGDLGEGGAVLPPGYYSTVEMGLDLNLNLRVNVSVNELPPSYGEV